MIMEMIKQYKNGQTDYDAEPDLKDLDKLKVSVLFITSTLAAQNHVRFSQQWTLIVYTGMLIWFADRNRAVDSDSMASAHRTS